MCTRARILTIYACNPVTIILFVSDASYVAENGDETTLL